MLCKPKYTTSPYFWWTNCNLRVLSQELSIPPRSVLIVPHRVTPSKPPMSMQVTLRPRHWSKRGHRRCWGEACSDRLSEHFTSYTGAELPHRLQICSSQNSQEQVLVKYMVSNSLSCRERPWSPLKVLPGPAPPSPTQPSPGASLVTTGVFLLGACLHWVHKCSLSPDSVPGVVLSSSSYTADPWTTWGLGAPTPMLSKMHGELWTPGNLTTNSLLWTRSLRGHVVADEHLRRRPCVLYTIFLPYRKLEKRNATEKNHRKRKYIYCIYWKNLHKNRPAQLKPVLFKGQL